LLASPQMSQWMISCFLPLCGKSQTNNYLRYSWRSTDQFTLVALHQGGNFWNQNDLFLSQNDCESKRSFFDMASEIRRKFANLFQICRLRSNLKSPSQVCDSRSHLWWECPGWWWPSSAQ
jgi:hypothetical protein